MQCPRCGESLEGDAAFCDACGTRLAASALAPVSPMQRQAASPPAVPAVAAPPLVAADTRSFSHSGYSAKANSPETAFSHWNQFIRGLDVAPLNFYRLVRAALEARRVPDISLSLVTIHEGGVFTAEREYLRVTRRDHVVDICGAPYGDGFFVAWWQGPRPGGCLRLLLLVPLVSLLYVKYLRPVTYYQVDTASMFITSVHGAVLDVLDQLTEGRGLRGLTELERKPIHRGFFGGK